MGGDLLAVFLRQPLEGLFPDRQHAACATRAVVQEVGAGLDLVRDGQEDQVRHQPHGIAGRPVLAGCLVVLIVEATDQFLEDRAHAMVVEAGVPDRAVAVEDRVGAEVQVGRDHLLDQPAKGVAPREFRDLRAELEVLNDVLHVRGEAVEVGLEVRPKLLLASAGAQVAHREP